MRITYAAAVYGKEEIKAVNRVLENPAKITYGEQTKRFEEVVAKLFGKKYGLMVNSGSSANLLAVELLNLPLGSEVITPILTFSTTLAPLVQKGLVPVFVDVEEGTYVINTQQIESLISSKTKALFIPSLIGNIPNMKELRRIAKKYQLYFVEDSCDTLGATFAGKPTGTYSDISTNSFYASHIITTAGGGGLLCFNKPDWLEKSIVMRSWGRQSSLFGTHEKSEDLKKRFTTAVIDNKIYDAKFVFSEIGYNFQPLELNAAFGLEQLKRLKKFTFTRRKNFKTLWSFFKQYENYFSLPLQHKEVMTNWLAFPITIRQGAPFTRLELVTFLEKNNVQTRPIFSGNILKQPAFRAINHRTLAGLYPITDHIMHHSLLIGCHHGLEEKHLDYLMGVLGKFFRR